MGYEEIAESLEGRQGVGLDCHMIDYFITREQGIAIIDKTRP